MFAWFYKLILLCVLFCCQACYKETAIKVVPDFEIEVVNEDYSVPVRVRIVNKTTGADFFEWTLEGGEPGSSLEMEPEEVVYREAGSYVIRLEAWNTTERQVKEYTLQLDSALAVGFKYTVVENNFAPVEVVFQEGCRGASVFEWEFEGGEPARSDLRCPPKVVFRDTGEHRVRLRVSNGREILEKTESVKVLPGLAVDFNWKPVFEDEDMEAPLTLVLESECESALFYRWSADKEGYMEEPASARTNVHMEREGTYRITLEAGNGKETKRCVKEVTVKPNTNLYCMQDIRLGISTAHTTIGCFYAPALRKTLSRNEVNTENGCKIDFVFLGLGEDFYSCCFISPDQADRKAFPAIPEATHTWFVHAPAGFSPEQFENMKDDSDLRRIVVREQSDENKDVHFKGEAVPYLILLETQDGRKGVIRINEFVKEGRQSYIRADLKIQKQTATVTD